MELIDMNYDVKINIPGLDRYTPSIIEYITKNYPECLQANSFVTVNFIRLIDKAGFLVVADFEDEYDDEPSLNATDKDNSGHIK